MEARGVGLQGAVQIGRFVPPDWSRATPTPSPTPTPRHGERQRVAYLAGERALRGNCLEEFLGR